MLARYVRRTRVTGKSSYFIYPTVSGCSPGHEGIGIVDVSDAFVDSSGIGVLVHVAQRARLERRDFGLVCREQLAAILRLHRLDEMLGVAPTVDVGEEVGWDRPLAA